ncbi:breast cancer anti-estrogen resistance protein 1 isoform X2 [Schistocerca gregaria]|uniref:breast cancer anti-estrogen resistance protein 1 isoform X2 n=1 Tax=Schistocerca gregaria TaxID=7010 RepID=UPI00211E117F|nr:breast cancer anti-estrogen resistance protein 1 isoform X2 [Schistocerca gregaria]
MMPQPEAAVLATQNCVARALYDNIAESPDELAFRRGDLLTVLEQNTAGIQGWWLCSLRGRQGICPGNRLRLLAGVYDTGGETVVADLNTLQRQGKRRSWHVQPNKVLTPQKVGDVYLYDLPPQRGPSAASAAVAAQEKYDVPPGSSHVVLPPEPVTSQDDASDDGESYDVPRGYYDVPRPARPLPSRPHTPTAPPTLTPSPTPPPSRTGSPGLTRSAPCRFAGGESYDVPRGCYDTPRYPRPTAVVPPAPAAPAGPQPCPDSYDVPRPLGAPLTPSSSASSLTADSSLPGSNRSSLLAAEYDVPRPQRPAFATPPPPPPQTPPQPDKQQQHQQQLYDVPPASSPLPLELGSALDSLERLQAEAAGATSRLLGLAGPQWRRRDRLEARLMDVRLAAVRLRSSLHDLADFCEGALGNAARAPDKALAPKLRPLARALRDADRLVQDAAAQLDAANWDLDRLARDQGEENCRTPDALDQLVACARALTEDVRQAASFIQGNSTLLFKRAASPPPPSSGSDWLEDYDYVNLESRESVARQDAEILDSLPAELRKSYDALVKEAESAAVIGEPKQTTETTPPADGSSELDANDRQVLAFYAAQTATHSALLTHAIDAFLQTVERNQPPKVFLAHGKFVVLSAHRLVHIGDTVHRNVVHPGVRARVLTCANALSEALATTVAKTKRAALHFPSVTAVQEMVDSVVDVSHLARDLKLSLIHQ